jgi:hypothetical protein
MKIIQEADRAIAAGAMEYVPEHRMAEVAACSTIHPWTIVDQGGGKWRLCHDYSVGTNRVVPTAPFALPSVWDVVSSMFGGRLGLRNTTSGTGSGTCPLPRTAQETIGGASSWHRLG